MGNKIRGAGASTPLGFKKPLFSHPIWGPLLKRSRYAGLKTHDTAEVLPITNLVGRTLQSAHGGEALGVLPPPSSSSSSLCHAVQLPISSSTFLLHLHSAAHGSIVHTRVPLLDFTEISRFEINPLHTSLQFNLPSTSSLSLPFPSLPFLSFPCPHVHIYFGCICSRTLRSLRRWCWLQFF